MLLSWPCLFYVSEASFVVLTSSPSQNAAFQMAWSAQNPSKRTSCGTLKVPADPPDLTKTPTGALFDVVIMTEDGYLEVGPEAQE